MTRDAWGYVRLSQEGRDGSIDDQLENIRDYCREHEELSLVTTRNEGTSTSGFNEDREEYQLLMGKVENDEIGAVVVRDRARLSRDFDERLRLVTLFRSVDVELHVLEQGGKIDLDDPQLAALESTHAAMDHVKKKLEIERAKEVVRERIEKGYYQGQPPLGLQFDDDGRYLVPGERFETALEIIDRRENGESEYSVAKDLDISRSSVRAVMKHKERYMEHTE